MCAGIDSLGPFDVCGTACDPSALDYDLCKSGLHQACASEDMLRSTFHCKPLPESMRTHTLPHLSAECNPSPPPPPAPSPPVVSELLPSPSLPLASHRGSSSRATRHVASAAQAAQLISVGSRPHDSHMLPSALQSRPRARRQSTSVSQSAHTPPRRWALRTCFI